MSKITHENMREEANDIRLQNTTGKYDYVIIEHILDVLDDYIDQQQKKDELLELYRKWHEFIAESNEDKTIYQIKRLEKELQDEL